MCLTVDRKLEGAEGDGEVLEMLKQMCPVILTVTRLCDMRVRELTVAFR
jgi:hypothetical protein